VNNPDSPYFESPVFQGILQFIQTRTNKGKLKQVGKNFMLVIDDVESMEQLHRLLATMHRDVFMPAENA
jgi:transcription-repair coupling factor (superfamily II helicase)